MPEIASVTHPNAGHGTGCYLRVAAVSDLGRQRTNNEDRFLLVNLTPPPALHPPDSEEDKPLGLPEPRGYPVGPKGYLLLVADGMGGAAGGEVASRLATRFLYHHLLDSWVFERSSSSEGFGSALARGIEKANQSIYRRSCEDQSLSGMGTTISAVGIVDGRLVLGYVGDSRVYLVRNREIVQLSEDQTLARRLVEAGKMTVEESESSPLRHKLWQALGPSDSVQVDLRCETACDQDTLILCTDGLSDLVSAREILEAVKRSQDPGVVTEDLVELANSRGGADNVTVIVARLHVE